MELNQRSAAGVSDNGSQVPSFWHAHSHQAPSHSEMAVLGAEAPKDAVAFEVVIIVLPWRRSVPNSALTRECRLVNHRRSHRSSVWLPHCSIARLTNSMPHLQAIITMCWCRSYSAGNEVTNQHNPAWLSTLAAPLSPVLWYSIEAAIIRRLTSSRQYHRMVWEYILVPGALGWFPSLKVTEILPILHDSRMGEGEGGWAEPAGWGLWIWKSLLFGLPPCPRCPCPPDQLYSANSSLVGNRGEAGWGWKHP